MPGPKCCGSSTKASHGGPLWPYGLDRKSNRAHPGLDLGGGTFDFSAAGGGRGVSRCSPPAATPIWAAMTSTR